MMRQHCINVVTTYFQHSVPAESTEGCLIIAVMLHFFFFFFDKNLYKMSQKNHYILPYLASSNWTNYICNKML